MDDQHAPDFGLIGFYSQPYNEIVRTNQVWRVSKYFLRRWGPYLGPTRFWTIVAARQLCYWNDHQDWFEGYDAQIAAAAQLSRAHFRRIKAEMGESANPLSLFISREETGYHVVNGKTRPKPTTYHVRLDDPLTPADAAYLTLWFHNQPLRRRPADLVELLQQAAQLPRQDLLSPHPGVGLQQPPACFTPITVHDILLQVYGRQIADQPEVRKQAEALHNHLTGADFVGKQYYRHEWLPLLKPGPGYLLAYLRSLCYFNEENGELRNRITVNRQELAERFGVKPNTLSDWIKGLTDAAPPQAVPPFMALIDSGRTADNSFEFIYEIGMLDPLTPGDLDRYRELAARYAPLEGSEGGNGGSAEFEIHKNGGGTPPQSENEPHGASPTFGPRSEKASHSEALAPPPQSDFESHESGPPHPPSSENERHDLPPDSILSLAQSEKARHSGEHDPLLSAGQPASEPASDRERYPFKYYKTLLALELEEQDLSTLLTAELAGTGWKLREAHLPVARAACHDNYEELLDLLEVDSGGPSRKRIRQGGLSLAETAAWWLYARTQARLDNPLNLVIARAAAGARPPATFQALVELSWEQWRSYAIARHLPPTDRPAWVDSPLCEHWMTLYREVPAEALPFGVGEGLSQAVELVYNRRCPLPEAALEPADKPGFAGDLWALLLEKIRPEIDPVLAAIFLDRVVVRRQTDGELRLGVPDQSARAYLVQTLGERLAREARLLTGSSWLIDFEVKSRVEEAGTVASPPVEIDQTERYRPLWAAVKNELALQMTRATFEQWLRRAELVYADGRLFRVGVDSESGRQWLAYRLNKTVVRTLRALSHEDEVEVEFVLLEPAAPDP